MKKILCRRYLLLNIPIQINEYTEGRKERKKRNQSVFLLSIVRDSSMINQQICV